MGKDCIAPAEHGSKVAGNPASPQGPRENRAAGRMRLKVDPGQLRVLGVRDRCSGHTRLVYLAGAGVTAQQVDWMRSFLEHPFVTILSTRLLKHPEPPQPSLIEELCSRGYDIATLRLSVYLRELAPAPLKRVRRLSIRPGVLQARWSSVEHCSPDLCTSWARPAARADSSLLIGRFSANCFPERFLTSLEPPSMRDCSSFLDDLQAHGFALRTLRMEVRMASSPETGS